MKVTIVSALNLRSLKGTSLNGTSMGVRRSLSSLACDGVPGESRAADRERDLARRE
jgi:hypothetical protein